ncbi:hypothetical protein C7T35_01280 [Variovorax sp. WS11]|uniref:hypothetical protein n=1 Tax=Variovorax sp. WS11 TaxID=1105204 RepID=UPI000D0D1217|nr:hypothetical protein [Variovorax sp. WS11]NDZ11515.1 hypothetical protein [Variovorax sp. WS11]PSL86629.1 hypothetical protein C7T35_01280 [Variovorax sp. WS11]
MEFLGQPFGIQNTSEGWLVTWNDAVLHGPKGAPDESVSFTVLLPRRADLTIAEVQTYALKRAAELLQHMIQAKTTPGQ